MAEAAATIGSSLRAVRERRGWSREELAYRSGVSFAAIAQIEAGRRSDIRLSSLSALAGALGVTIDRLAGVEAQPAPGLEHRVLAYGSDDELLRVAVPFLAEGVALEERVLVITSKRILELLRDALGAQAATVEFLDAADWYTSAQDAIARYRSLLDGPDAPSVPWTRIVGELAWDWSSPAETTHWTRYESLVNVLFAPAEVSFICIYDTRTVPADIVADAHHTHPTTLDAEGTRPNEQYRAPEDFLLT